MLWVDCHKICEMGDYGLEKELVKFWEVRVGVSTPAC